MDLLKKGATVSYNDPHIPELPRMRRWPHLAMTSSQLTPEFLTQQDCVLIVSYRWLVNDTRNAKSVTAGREKIVRA